MGKRDTHERIACLLMGLAGAIFVVAALAVMAVHEGHRPPQPQTHRSSDKRSDDTPSSEALLARLLELEETLQRVHTPNRLGDDLEDKHSEP